MLLKTFYVLISDLVLSDRIGHQEQKWPGCVKLDMKEYHHRDRYYLDEILTLRRAHIHYQIRHGTDTHFIKVTIPQFNHIKLQI